MKQKVRENLTAEITDLTGRIAELQDLLCDAKWLIGSISEDPLSEGYLWTVPRDEWTQQRDAWLKRLANEH